METSQQRSRTDALIHLLGDEDARIASTAWEHLEHMGELAVPSLEVAVSTSPDPRVRAQARKFLVEWRRREVFQQWVAFSRARVLGLEEGAFLIARSEYPEIDPAVWRRELDQYARVLRRRIRTARSANTAVDALVHLLAEEAGFRGNVETYFDPDNSYLHRVIERKVGIPISLATVYLLVARRASVPIEPVAMPLHFLLKTEVRAGMRSAEQFIDPFAGGVRLTSRECAQMLRENGIPFRAAYLEAATDRQILTRMLGNLLRVYHGLGDQRRLNRVTAMLKLLE